MANLILGNVIIAMNEIINYNIPITVITIQNFQPNQDFKNLVDGIFQNFNCELIEFEDRFDGYTILKINNYFILIQYNWNLTGSYNLTFRKFEILNDIYDLIMPIMPYIIKTPHFEQELLGPIEDF
jgi:hypothetical protein